MTVYISDPNLRKESGDSKLGWGIELLKLKSIYNTYSQQVYSLCLQMLTNEKDAELATVDVFVQFSKEATSISDEILLPSRLRELAIHASITRLRRRSEKVVLRFLRGLQARPHQRENRAILRGKK
jgi:hypothetical protein